MSLSQLVRHRPVPVSQMKDPHCTVLCPGHAPPRPSQKAGASDVAVPEHVGPLHWLLVL